METTTLSTRHDHLIDLIGRSSCAKLAHRLINQNNALTAALDGAVEALEDLENAFSCKPYDRDEQKILLRARAALDAAKKARD